MGIMKGKADAADLPKVRYEVAGKEIDLENANRMVRKLMQSIAAKQQKNFSKYVHPETGERPDLVLVLPDPSKPSIQCRLVTDSEVLRAWLKEQGVVIGEVVNEPAQPAP
jgi:hypothetical protein